LRPVGGEVLVIRVVAYAPGGDWAYGVTHFPGRQTAATTPAWGRSPTASCSSSPPTENKVDVAACLAWTRRGRHPCTVAGHRGRRSRLPRPCRGPGSRRLSPVDKIADAAGGSGGSAAPVKRPRSACACPGMPMAAAHGQATGHAGSLPV